jgi:RNA polymerase sigma factor (sigma-70 family)
MGKEYQINSDTLLWNKFIAGDQKAFRDIYNRYVQSLYRFGCHFTNDHALVKDCIQDIFVKLARSRSGLGSTNNIKLYLFKSLKRKIIKSLDKSGIIGSIDLEKLPFIYTVSVEDDIIDDESERIRYVQLDKAMSNLSPRQKEAIYLKFVSDLSYAELSKVMNMNYQSARNLVFRGMEKLRESFPKNLFLFFLPSNRLRLKR